MSGSLQEIQEEAVTRNSLWPTRITEVVVNGGKTLREGFLASQLDPLLSTSNFPDKFGNVLSQIDKTIDTIDSFGTHTVEMVRLDLAEGKVNDTLNLVANLDLKQATPYYYTLKTYSNDDYSGLTFNAGLRNLFGGAERLEIASVVDSRPFSRSSVHAKLISPFNGSPTFTISAEGFADSRSLPWASHSHVLRGGLLKFTKLISSGFGDITSELGIKGTLRTILGISPAASDSVRAVAGDNFAAGLFARLSGGSFDDDINPTKGLKLDAQLESYGKNLKHVKLPGDVSYGKAVVTGSAAIPLSSRLVLQATGVTGLLQGSNHILTDRFYLGGKDTLYGFQPNGVGPKDDSDSIGGDSFYYGRVALVGKIWSKNKTVSPLRVLGFYNAGSLQLSDGASKGPVREPSSAIGAGITYRTKVAQLELTYAVPISAAQTDLTRRGLQFNVGIEVL